MQWLPFYGIVCQHSSYILIQPFQLRLRDSCCACTGHADMTNPSDPDEYGIKGSDLFHDLFLCKPAYFWTVEWGVHIKFFKSVKSKFCQTDSGRCSGVRGLTVPPTVGRPFIRFKFQVTVSTVRVIPLSLTATRNLQSNLSRT